ncbi:extracellular matrix/biofilm biosynthesis regulator RemA family protein [Desulforhopalus sp. 52FAK]
MQLLNVGFGNTVMVERVIAVVNTGSSPARKLKEAAKNDGRLVDVTEGRRTRSILVMDSNHVVLSSVQADTISQRMHALQPGYHLAEYQSLVAAGERSQNEPR